MNKDEEIKQLKAIIKEQNEQLRLHSVSNCIATEYAEFCVRCDREKLPLLCLEDYIKQYCCQRSRALRSAGLVETNLST